MALHRLRLTLPMKKTFGGPSTALGHNEGTVHRNCHQSARSPSQLCVCPYIIKTKFLISRPEKFRGLCKQFSGFVVH